MANDAFISYSHSTDIELAAATEKGLERLAKPLFAIRAMEVFRDASDLPANPGLWPMLEAELEASRWFIFFASRASAQSAYCNEEVKWWVSHRGTGQVLLVLTEGQIVWDRSRGDFDWTATDVLPQCFSKAFAAEPLHVDLRALRQERHPSLSNATFRAAMLDLAAPIRGVPKNSLDAEDVRLHRRLRWLARTAVAAIATVGIAATVMAMIARQQARLSLARQLSAQALQVVRAQPDLGLLLAVEAQRVADTVQGRMALLGALLDRPHLRRVMHGVTQTQLEQQGFRFFEPTQLAKKRPVAPGNRTVSCEGGVDSSSPSSDGRMVVYGCHAGGVRIADGNEVWSGYTRIGHSQPVMSVLFVDGDRVAVSGGYDGRILLWHAASGVGMEPAFADNELPVLALGLSADGKQLVSLHERAPAKLWDLTMRARLARSLGGSNSIEERLDVLGREALRTEVILWKAGDAQRLAVSIPHPNPADRLIDRANASQPGFASQPASVPRPGLADVAPEIGVAVDLRQDGTSELQVLSGASGVSARFKVPGFVGPTAVAPGGKRLAGAIDSMLWIWSLPTGTVAAGPVKLESEPQILRFDRAGQWLVAGLADGRIQPLDPNTGRPLREPIEAHLSSALLGVRSLAASSDGKNLASGGPDGLVILWDTATWQRLANLPAHGFVSRAGPFLEGQVAVDVLGFSPDGSSLAARSIDGIGIWFRGDQEWTRRSLSAQDVSAIAYTPDGLGLVTDGGDGPLRWTLDSKQWARQACEIAGRNLTETEWRQYLTFAAESGLPGLRLFDPEYRATCPDFPMS